MSFAFDNLGPPPTSEELEEIRKSQEDKRRRVAVSIHEQELHEMLGVPEGVEIQHFYFDFMSQSLVVILRSDSFEVVPEAAEPPMVQKHIEWVECNKGRIHCDLWLPKPTK